MTLNNLVQHSRFNGALGTVLPPEEQIDLRVPGTVKVKLDMGPEVAAKPQNLYKVDTGGGKATEEKLAATSADGDLPYLPPAAALADDAAKGADDDAKAADAGAADAPASDATAPSAPAAAASAAASDDATATAPAADAAPTASWSQTLTPLTPGPVEGSPAVQLSQTEAMQALENALAQVQASP